jgi:DNA-binding HxlR family transcriptional regulator
MLSMQLRERERDEVISRKVYPVVPPKTEYSLTEWGKTLIPVVKAIAEWGVKLFDREGVDLPC